MTLKGNCRVWIAQIGEAKFREALQRVIILNWTSQLHLPALGEPYSIPKYYQLGELHGIKGVSVLRTEYGYLHHG